jgi:hypothetical protein
MDFYLNPENSKNRLIEEYKTHGSLVVAFDFDDTVYDFHKKRRLYIMRPKNWTEKTDKLR